MFKATGDSLFIFSKLYFILLTCSISDVVCAVMKQNSTTLAVGLNCAWGVLTVSEIKLLNESWLMGDVVPAYPVAHLVD